MIVHRLTFTAAAQPSHSCQNTCKYRIAVAVMVSELLWPTQCKWHTPNPHTQTGKHNRNTSKTHQNLLVCFYLASFAAAHEFNCFYLEYKTQLLVTFCVDMGFVTSDYYNPRDTIAITFRLDRVPIIDVKSSGAELPAAMKVAPATSSLRWRRCKTKTEEGKKIISRQGANRKLQKCWKCVWGDMKVPRTASPEREQSSRHTPTPGHRTCRSPDGRRQCEHIVKNQYETDHRNSPAIQTNTLNTASKSNTKGLWFSPAQLPDDSSVAASYLGTVTTWKKIFLLLLCFFKDGGKKVLKDEKGFLKKNGQKPEI